MIHPESIKKDYDIKNVQWSVLGFITNIVIVLFWLLNLWFWSSTFTSSRSDALESVVAFLIMATVLNLLGFHLYALLKPDYGNTEEYEDLSLAAVLKNHWAIISGTTLFFLAVGSFSSALFIKTRFKFVTENVKIVLSVVLVLYSVAGMICWGFVTNNRRNILARIVRPWQINEQTEDKTGAV